MRCGQVACWHLSIKPTALDSARRRRCRWGCIRKGSNRVNRGGSWNNNARNCRVSYRYDSSPTNANYVFGLRLAL